MAVIIMQFSQSRANSRGALIAVIKIEIDSRRTDRIFLHQNDDDHRLAEQFVAKHALDPSIAVHIYDRIAFSRRSVESKGSKQNATPPPANANANNQQQQVTPYHNLYSQREDLLSHREDKQSFESSFGQLFKKSVQETIKNPSLFQTDQGETSVKHHQYCPRQDILQAPAKRLFEDRQFRLYQDQSQPQETPIMLFPSKEPKRNVNHSPPPKKHTYDTVQSSNRSNKIQEILEKRQAVSDYLKGSQSLPKFKSNNPRPSTPLSNKKSQYDKPIHVKIMKKDQIQSLNQSLKRSLSRQDLSRINKDVTSRLYNEADIKKSYLNIIKEKAKKEKEELEDVELTHRPEINKISRVIAEGRRKDMPVEQYLIEQGKKIELKRQEEINRKHLHQIDNCTFQPQMNLISQKLAAERAKFDSKIDKKCKYQDENMFRPSLSKVTEELMRDKGNFQSRQREFLEMKNSKLVEKVKEKRHKEKVDPVTGKQLFRPQINDLGVRESQGSNIGHYLYQKGRESCAREQQPQTRPKINESSQAIVQQLHLKRISWLFSELDSDQDGTISSQRIDITSIPPELLNIIKPVLFQMQQMNTQLNLHEFRNAITMLHRQLSTYQKNILYHARHK